MPLDHRTDHYTGNYEGQKREKNCDIGWIRGSFAHLLMVCKSYLQLEGFKILKQCINQDIVYVHTAASFKGEKMG